MKLAYLPWLVLLLAGIVYTLVAQGVMSFVVGLVMALSGSLGWAVVARRYRK